MAPPEALALTAEDRGELLRLARAAIEARLQGGAPSAGAPSRALAERCGVFVSLRRRDSGELRGCVGYLEPCFRLGEAVVRAAVAAATADGRFDPVTLAELPSLALDVSVLGRPRPLAPDQVEVGVHGLLVRCGGRSGLLLPQVATEHGWDREAFLDHACLKAGLPPGAWREPGAELLAFTAVVVHEDGAA